MSDNQTEQKIAVCLQDKFDSNTKTDFTLAIGSSEIRFFMEESDTPTFTVEFRHGYLLFQVTNNTAQTPNAQVGVVEPAQPSSADSNQGDKKGV